MTRVGYFGGSFDPPHAGHLAVALAAADRFALDRVVLAPTGRQPLKPGGPRCSFADRLRMTELLCAQDATGRLQASGLDAPLPNGVPNYTVDTLARLAAGLPNGSAVFSVVGADAFLDLRRWREPERLLQLAEWIVVSRPGLAEAQLDGLGLSLAQRARVHWLGGVAVPVSATEIRARLAARQGCAGMLSEAVLGYIAEHGLYGGA